MGALLKDKRVRYALLVLLFAALSYAGFAPDDFAGAADVVGAGGAP